jgi:broad specificity phosphatase PhoE
MTAEAQSPNRYNPVTPTRVWLLRHAETAAPNVFHGAESDVGLGDRGRRQSEALAPVVAGWQPTALVSSAMLRARQTAQPLEVACGLEVQVEPELHERRVGALGGTPYQVGEGVWPDTLRRWVGGDTAFAPEGAESFDAIRDRVLPVWHRVTAQHAGGRLVIVAHGVVVRVLLLSLGLGMGPVDWHRLGPIRNLAVHELEGWAGRWRLLRANEVPEAVLGVD